MLELSSHTAITGPWPVSTGNAPDFDRTDVLLEHVADLAAKNVNGSTALHMGISSGASVEVIDLLLRSVASALIDRPNRFDYSPLRVAIERGREDIVQLLREFQKAGP